MSNHEWERFGEEIRRNVQDAVDSRDFSRLNQTITDAINGAADGISRGMRGAAGGISQGVQDAMHRNAGSTRGRHSYRNGENTGDFSGGYRYQGGFGPADGAWQQENGEQSNGSFQQAQGQTNQRYNWNKAYYSRFGNRDVVYPEQEEYADSSSGGKQLPALYAGALPAKIGGTALSVVGCTLGSCCMIALAIVLIVGFLGGGMNMGMWIAIGVLALCSGVFGGLAGAGARMLGRVKRFRSYISNLGSREYCSVKELADHLGKSSKYVIKDLERMIRKGWFRQGHLDMQKTCLMVSDGAYKQYTDLLQQTEQQRQEETRKRAEELQKQAEDEDSDLSPEVREVVRTGEEYIRKIHACNDAIQGAEISAKISRMEMLVDRIFDRVEQNPETVSELHRMMEYYLPTTVKLLEAYEELDAQPVQGANILSSRQEIEKTLDTLNVAFEKLLDGLFQDTAWDVSSDISVLHTMLAQEGLTEKDF